MTISQCDIAIIGGGPAGMALCSALVARGVDAVVVDDRADVAWSARYGDWVDVLAASGLSSFTGRSWSRAVVHTPETTHLERAYALLDNQALYAELRGRIGSARVQARVVERSSDAAGATLHLDSGASLGARAVVDCTGRGPASVFQVAYGVELVGVEHGLDLDTFQWMDFRGPEHAVPTFLYAAPIDATRVFVEETVLATDQPVQLAALRHRLAQRLEGLGWSGARWENEERCRIAMDIPPRAAQDVVRFGAAGGWVHPATGYSVSRAFQLAPMLADVLATNLNERPAVLVDRAHRALWTPERRMIRGLQDLGQAVLLGMNTQQTRDFFQQFFALPMDAQRRYLMPDTVTDVAGPMWTLFQQAPSSLRWRLVRDGSAAPLQALRAGLQQSSKNESGALSALARERGDA